MEKELKLDHQDIWGECSPQSIPWLFLEVLWLRWVFGFLTPNPWKFDNFWVLKLFVDYYYSFWSNTGVTINCVTYWTVVGYYWESVTRTKDIWRANWCPDVRLNCINIYIYIYADVQVWIENSVTFWFLGNVRITKETLPKFLRKPKGLRFP